MDASTLLVVMVTVGALVSVQLALLWLRNIVRSRLHPAVVVMPAQTGAAGHRDPEE
jgi:hypothetical protein